ncbi:MAG: alpha/beta hydrolase [Gammaproteobacteria bacterium]|nr:alpha/beta hydrolase [Gammaproteobacteria bacterium]
MEKIIIHFLMLSCLSYSMAGFSQTVILQNDASVTMTADYLEGTVDMSPVLVLHGFLQTNQFSTVRRLASVLNESGITVLTPTLSLGLDSRKQSLSCEAIHTHTMNTDTNELLQWLTWLHNKTGKKVTLVGHSAAGPTILNLIEKQGMEQIHHVILISLSYYASGPSANETEAQAIKAREQIRSGSNALEIYALNYCKTYPTYPESFLSYYSWDKAKVEKLVGNYSKNISIIIGTKDKRIDEAWGKQLNTAYGNVISIKGANHFFDQAYEFDLTDSIETLLNIHNRK